MTGETRIIVNPNPTEWVYTGNTINNAVGSGNTTVTIDGTTMTIYSPTGGTAAWGNISGTLSDQADLQSALDLKLASTGLTGYWDSGQTTTWVNDQGFINSLAGYWTSAQTSTYISGLNYVTASIIDNIWTSGQTQTWVNDQGFITSLAGYWNSGQTVSYINDQGFITSLAGYWTSGQTIDYVTGYTPTLDGYWNSGQTVSYISGLNYVTASIIDNIWTSGQTQTWVNDQGFLTGITGYVSTTDFNAYTGSTDTRLNGIEDDISTLDSQVAYLSGQTDLRLKTADFNAYSASTESSIDSKASQVDLDTVSGLTITNYNLITGNTENISENSTQIQNHVKYTQSAGLVSGGTITSGGTGIVDVSAGLAYFKTTNSGIAETLSINFSAEIGLALTDNVTNYIYLDYNSGVPTINVSTTKSRNGRTQFNLGSVFREGDSVHILQGGLNVTELAKRVQQNLIEIYGIKHASGAIVSETGTRNIAITAGVFYSGLNRLTTGALDTSGTDEFEYYYYDGAWQETDATAISATQYNNYGVGLATLSPNQYGIHWVYISNDGELLVVYGLDSYTLTEAQNEQPPANLPPHVTDFSALAAKIIIERNDTTFTEVESAWSTVFQTSAAQNHNDLSAIQGGTANEYYHLTSAEAALVPDISGKTNQTDFNTHSGDTSIHFEMSGITGFTSSQTFNAYTGATETELGNKLNTSVYSTYTGTTAPATYAPINATDNMWTSGQTVSYVTGQTATKANLDATIVAITAATTINATYKGKIIEANGTFTITLPDGMPTGYRVDIMNVGSGTITLAASTTLQSDGTKLETQYTGASVYHRGSNVWIAVGKLTT